MGAGNLDVHIDPADMEGELEVLTNAFNEMTTKIRGAQEDLEQTVADRTEELRDSEERYRTQFEDSRNAIFISSGDGSVIDVNQAASSSSRSPGRRRSAPTSAAGSRTRKTETASAPR